MGKGRAAGRGGSRGGWKLTWRADREQFYVRFRTGAKRYQLATNSADRREAEKEAERIYLSVCKSKARPSRRGQLLVLKPLVTLLAEWIGSLEGVLDDETVKTYEGYASTHWTVFKTLDDVADDGKLGDYARERIRHVMRKTMQKELSALFGFLKWCKEHGALAQLPVRPELPAKARGIRVGTQRQKANELSPRQVEAFLAELPEWSHDGRGREREAEDPVTVAQIRALHEKGRTYHEIARSLNAQGITRPRGGKWHPSQVRLAAMDERPRAVRAIGRDHFPIRAKFEIAYETSLRPATLSALTWGAWTGSELLISEANDKNRMARAVPLSKRAVEVLEGLAKARGGRPKADTLIFGEHDYRSAFKLAARLAGISAKLAPYDFRHARQTHLVDAGAPLTGVMYLAGHTQLSTTSRYTKPTERAARAALEAIDPGPQMAPGSQSVGAKDGSRTRTGVTPLEPESGDSEAFDGKTSSEGTRRTRQESAGFFTTRRATGTQVTVDCKYPTTEHTFGPSAIPLLPPAPADAVAGPTVALVAGEFHIVGEVDLSPEDRAALLGIVRRAYAALRGTSEDGNEGSEGNDRRQQDGGGGAGADEGARAGDQADHDDDLGGGHVLVGQAHRDRSTVGVARSARGCDCVDSDGPAELSDTERPPSAHDVACKCGECVAAWRQFLGHAAGTVLEEIFVARGGEVSP